MPTIFVRSTLAICLTVALLGLSPAPRPAEAAGVWYVATTGSDSNDCASPGTPCATISAAIDRAAAGDEVRLAIGTYTGAGPWVASLTQDLTLSGGWEATFASQTGLSAIDGEGARSGVYVFPGAHLTLDHVHIRHAVPAIHNRGALTLQNSLLSENQTTALYNNGGTIHVWASTIANNTGGPAVRNVVGSLTLVNSTISDNHGGAGISGPASLYNSTVTANDAGLVLGPSQGAQIANSILAGNPGGDCVEDSNQVGTFIINLGHNLIGKTTRGCGNATTDLTNVNPRLSPLDDYGGLLPLRGLSGNSPAINAGNPAGCLDPDGLALTTDQRGVARSGRCDVGAFEARLAIQASYTGQIAPSSLVTFSVEVSNPNGVADLAGVVLTSSLSTQFALDHGSAWASNGIPSLDANQLTWTGVVSGSTPAQLRFAAVITDTFSGTPLANVLQAQWADELVTTQVEFSNPGRIHLPMTMRSYCRDLSDDFSDPASGWFTIDSDLRRVEYLDGEYRTLTKQSGYIFLYQAPACPREDYMVSADMRWAGPQTGALIGLIFGATQDFSRFYYISLATDEYRFYLYRFEPDTVLELAQGFTPVIRPGTGSNHMTVVRQGSAITLYINYYRMATYQDAAITGLTWTGLALVPYSNVPVVDARFDNFKLTDVWTNGYIHVAEAPLPPAVGARPPARPDLAVLRLIKPGQRADP